MFKSLSGMKVKKQFKISTAHVEICQRHRFPLGLLLHHNSRQIRGDSAGSDTTPGANHAEHFSSPPLVFCRPALKSLFEPREDRFNILAGQWLRKKLSDSNAKCLQK